MGERSPGEIRNPFANPYELVQGFKPLCPLHFGERTKNISRHTPASQVLHAGAVEGKLALADL